MKPIYIALCFMLAPIMSIHAQSTQSAISLLTGTWRLKACNDHWQPYSDDLKLFSIGVKNGRLQIKRSDDAGELRVVAECSIDSVYTRADGWHFVLRSESKLKKEPGTIMSINSFWLYKVDGKVRLEQETILVKISSGGWADNSPTLVRFRYLGPFDLAKCLNDKKSDFDTVAFSFVGLFD